VRRETCVPRRDRHRDRLEVKYCVSHDGAAALVARAGAVIEPAFAVGRAQSLLYHLHLLKASEETLHGPCTIPDYLESCEP